MPLGVVCTERCALCGKRVVIKSGRRRISGTCRAVDDDGRLIIETRGTTERYATGTIESTDW